MATEPTSEAYEAATRALERRIYGDAQDHTTPCAADARAAVDAVWPLAEAQVRAKVAAEIRDGIARFLSEPNADHPLMVGAEIAARIAEGKGDET